MSIAEIRIDPKLMDGILQDHIRAAIVAALSEKGSAERLVKAVVDAALQEKRNSYDRETIFQAEVSRMIRQAASDAAKEWVEEVRPAIKEQVSQALGKTKDNLVAKVADKLAAGFVGDWRVSIKLPGED